MKDSNTGWEVHEMEIATPIKKFKVSQIPHLKMHLEAGDSIYVITEGHTLADIARFFIRQCGCKSDAVYLINNVNKKLKK